MREPTDGLGCAAGTVCGLTERVEEAHSVLEALAQRTVHGSGPCGRGNATLEPGDN